MNINGTIELITKDSGIFTSGDIIAIVVSLISLIGVLISTFLTNRTTKKISKSNELLQEKWNQKNIDASLIANARIEWIQNVRNSTAELISLYTALLNTHRSDELINIISESRRTSELLILYFGPEADNNVDISDINLELLLKGHDNNNKNDLIVYFLRKQQVQFNMHYKDLMNKKPEKIKADIIYWSKQRYDNADKGPDFIYYDDDGNEYCDNEPIVNEYDESQYQNALSLDKNEKDKIVNLEKSLKFLCDFMRIYLKIEWIKAKRAE